MNISNLKIKYLVGVLAIVEAISFFASFSAGAKGLFFFAVCAFALIVSAIDLKYGVYLVFAELFISSKGYLFALDADGFSISIRIALWLIVMSVWLSGRISGLIRDRKPDISLFTSPLFPYFFVLFMFISWGLLNGFLNGNGFENIFFDFNGWLYFALVFPVYDGLKSRKDLENLWRLMFACMIWLAVKTLLLLYLFSHEIFFIKDIYAWVRNTGVGEITKMEKGFYRIFFQSHIYLIPWYLYMLMASSRAKRGVDFLENDSRDQRNGASMDFILLVLFLASLLISLSRSYLVGFVAGLGVIIIHLALIFGKNSRKYGYAVFIFVASLAASMCLIFLLVKFPFPRATGNFSLNDFSERATQIDGEAGASSRWSLLPALWDGISASPLAGSGFGATMTYKSSDPRVLENNPDGDYTTYAFEWGWLDIWMKLGLIGLIAYVCLILRIFIGIWSSSSINPAQEKKSAGFFSRMIKNGASWLDRVSGFFGYRRYDLSGGTIFSGLSAGICAICAINIFSPYLNHPIGIGFLVLCAITMERMRSY